MSIQKVKRITIDLDDPDEEATVFIRAIKSNIINIKLRVVLKN